MINFRSIEILPKAFDQLFLPEKWVQIYTNKKHRCKINVIQFENINVGLNVLVQYIIKNTR